jgi:hypothetical protein
MSHPRWLEKRHEGMIGYWHITVNRAIIILYTATLPGALSVEGPRRAWRGGRWHHAWAGVFPGSIVLERGIDA